MLEIFLYAKAKHLLLWNIVPEKPFRSLEVLGTQKQVLEKELKEYIEKLED